VSQKPKKDQGQIFCVIFFVVFVKQKIRGKTGIEILVDFLGKVFDMGCLRICKYIFCGVFVFELPLPRSTKDVLKKNQEKNVGRWVGGSWVWDLAHVRGRPVDFLAGPSQLLRLRQRLRWDGDIGSNPGIRVVSRDSGPM
jgi:hypothetical protein